MENKLIGFVVAMEKEARLLLNNCESVEEISQSTKRIYRGRLQNKNFVLIIAGIGKVNSAMSTQLLLDNYSPSLLINFGVAGGKKGSGLNAGDIVQIKEACQYDFDLSELDNVNIGYMQDYNLTYYPLSICENLSKNYKLVKCASGDRFTSKKLYLDIIKNLGAEVVDMECGAIAQVALANNIPLHSIKLISDVDGKEESVYSQYANNVETICNKIPNTIEDLIKNI